ncbi:hypothetical protein DU504_04645 [Haloplanus salinus]|uniref:Uncharacterized protein n=1 Tax=Haloplanus salinus TaxID=1126245 RepID=A0A368NAU0_9EURY|nr:hypothetical protein [Haloplanus salinus]RCU46654.1 hypothetical protein DU504_04645 [Haloplanus salinus]
MARHRASDARRSTNPTRAIADDRDPRSRFDGGRAERDAVGADGCGAERRGPEGFVTAPPEK